MPLFIHEVYEFIVKEDFSLKLDRAQVESVFIELAGVSGGKKYYCIIIGGIYNPLNSVVKYFSESLSSLLHLINKPAKLCYIFQLLSLSLF